MQNCINTNRFALSKVHSIKILIRLTAFFPFSFFSSSNSICLALFVCGSHFPSSHSSHSSSSIFHLPILCPDMIALIIAYTITINFNSISQRGSTVLSLPEKKRKNKKREILRSTVQKGLYPQRKKRRKVRWPACQRQPSYTHLSL